MLKKGMLNGLKKDMPSAPCLHDTKDIVVAEKYFHIMIQKMLMQFIFCADIR